MPPGSLPQPPAPPKLRSRHRTDPALTFSKLHDVVSPHCGIVTGVERMALRERGMEGAYMYGVTLEVATAMGYNSFKKRRHEFTEIWRIGAEGRNGHRMAFDRTRAFVRAVGEALERYACCTYDPADFIEAPWTQVRDVALDPRACQMPSAEEYAGLEGLAPFREDAPMRWTWGWSLRDEKPKLIPAQLCYLMYNPIPGEPMMQATSSTGWALHHTFEEAIHTGMREIVERDAFFLAWLNRLKLPRLDLDSVTDPAIVRFRDEMKRIGTDFRVYVTTNDVGIPSFAALVLDRRPGHPAFLLTLGAHPDPVRGLRQAVEEAAMMHLDVTMRVRTDQVDAPERMQDIQRMSHHGDYYLKQENLGPIEWLLHDERTMRLDDIENHGSRDVWEEVRYMVDRFAAAGMDPLFVDATPADLKEAGWCAAKTLVPGTIRHEYGYGVRYLDCARIYEAPVRMGVRDKASTPADINPDAHPYS